MENIELNTLDKRKKTIMLNRVEQYAWKFFADNTRDTLVNENYLQKTFKDCIIPAPKFLYALIIDKIIKMKSDGKSKFNNEI
jgi:hypothetical protein